MTFPRQPGRGFKERFIIGLSSVWVAGLIGFLVSLLYRTWRVAQVNEARMQALVQEHGAVILVTWHGRLLVPTAASHHRGYYALISHSRDGTLLSAIFERLGWKLIRGSTGRRAVQALRQGCQILEMPGTVLAFTPDGPRGPAREAKPGMIYYAQKTGKPLVPVGVSARPRRFIKSWDQFLVPLPFARCVLIYGEPIFVGPDEDVAEVACRVQVAINGLEAEADRQLGIVPTVVESVPLAEPPPVPVAVPVAGDDPAVAPVVASVPLAPRPDKPVLAISAERQRQAEELALRNREVLAEAEQIAVRLRSAVSAMGETVQHSQALCTQTRLNHRTRTHVSD